MGQPTPGARELPGIKKGIRIGSARDGRVTAFIEDQESTAADHAGAEGVGGGRFLILDEGGDAAVARAADANALLDAGQLTGAGVGSPRL